MKLTKTQKAVCEKLKAGHLIICSYPSGRYHIDGQTITAPTMKALWRLGLPSFLCGAIHYGPSAKLCKLWDAERRYRIWEPAT